MKTMKEVKEYLKETAVEIRKKKNQRKESTYGYVFGLDTLRSSYRDTHIAYCLLRGTPAEKIEHNTDYIKASWSFISKIMSNISKEEITKEAFNVA